jgi:two-component system chemotaxis response regulator CheB
MRCPGRVLVAMLTGMGHDGLAGSRQVVAGGGGVVAQDEATSVVWGMPGAAVRLNAAMHTLPLPLIASAVTHAFRNPRKVGS